MKRTLIIAMIFLATATALHAKKITGKVHHNKKGLPGVVVSDGIKFTITNPDGTFTIDTHKDARHVFIVTPSGYVASCDSGTPHFYRSIDEKDFTFELFRWGTPGGPYTLFAVGDPQPKGDREFERLEKEGYADMKEHAEKIINGTDIPHSFTIAGTPVISILLGDILWDNPQYYPKMKQAIKEIGHPVYPVIGNHDHDLKVADDAASAHIYEDYFGPANYAFNAGEDYYIILDNILYEGNKKYKEGVNEKQIKWVKDYLKYVPEGSHIYLAMHAPISYYRGNYKIVNSEQLMDAFKGYDVTVLSGHTHVQCNSQPRENIREYNIASIGGAWWLWDCKYSKDGTPLGYQVFQHKGKLARNYYKALGQRNDYQTRIFSPGTIAGYPDDIILKIWNWDKRWSITASQCIGDSTKSEPVEIEQISMPDPDYSSYLQKEYIFNKNKAGKGS
ncbi:MAG: calcineurin-like phosphoesterase C-terminal domain-containing protein, partial [Bacteroidales bacterium]|nr:calcineurin-like phosphoesterase C-terminal domain-containing protein [Bacteroidales bacterium]